MIEADQDELKNIISVVEVMFESQLETHIREHRHEDAVGKWLQMGMTEENVFGYLVGLPLLVDEQWWI